MNDEKPQNPVVSGDTSPPLPTVSRATKIHKVKIEDHYKDDALEKVRQIVKGNGIDPADVTLASFDGALLHFESQTDLIISTKITKKIQAGRMTEPVQVANESALNETISKEYLKLFSDADTQRKIRDIALKREDLGFGLKGEYLQIPFWKKDFVFFEPCNTCRSTGKLQCRNCAGKGTSLCNRCSGKGSVHCSHCHGAKMVAAPQQGRKVQCPVCHGRGNMSCNGCQQTGKIQCRTCASKGYTTCTHCQGHAWNSHLTIVNIQARAEFKYPHEELPEKVCALIDKHGAKIRDHAKIHVMEKFTSVLDDVESEEENKAEKEEKQKILHIPIYYEVSLPYGHIEFEINGKSYYTFLFGIRGKLAYVSPFLDDLLKNGVRKILDAVEGRGDAAENLKAAAKYRSIRNAIVYTSRFSLRKAQERLLKDFPIGLSEEQAQEIITGCDKALKGISRKPRQIGLLSSFFAMYGFYVLYFSMVRDFAYVRLPPLASLHHVLDVSVLLAGVLIGALVIQTAANLKISKVLRQIVGDVKAAMAAKLGSTSVWNFILGGVAFLLSVETARNLGEEIPIWYQTLITIVGI